MWLADENIPGQAIAFLRDCGEDVVAITEIRHGISDQRVLDLAVDQKRVLLSFDRDHGDLIFNRGAKPPRAIVYFRLYPPDLERLKLVLSSLVALGPNGLDGQFTVVSVNGMRQRPLTATS